MEVALSTINRWENGRAKPSPLAILKMRELIVSMGNDGKYLVDRFVEDNL
jgi:putative transcriptional regulator